VQWWRRLKRVTTLQVRLTKEQEAALEAAQVFWESYAAWNRCPDDQNKKAAFIAGYVVGWERGEFPPLPSENVVPVDF
jgi:hypothetical protein